jgi:hypothetical protein
MGLSGERVKVKDPATYGRQDAEQAALRLRVDIVEKLNQYTD